MIDWKTRGAAIMAAILAAVIAGPSSVHGQPAPLPENHFHSEPRTSEPLPERSAERSAERISVLTCMRFGMCPDDVRDNQPDGRASARPNSSTDDWGRDAAGAGLDRSVLFTVHGWSSRTATRVLGTADASAYPVFAAAPIALWVSAAVDRIPQEDAVAGTVALAAGFGTTMLLKRIVGRKRPYAAIDGFSPRSEYSGSRGLTETASFPSGHATLAGIIATGASLLIRHPAATTGAVLWAGTVSVSRVWLGVHYPTDVLTGVALGSGATLLGYSILQ